MSDDENVAPDPPTEQETPPPDESPFTTTPQLEEIGKNLDPPGVERRDD